MCTGNNVQNLRSGNATTLSPPPPLPPSSSPIPDSRFLLRPIVKFSEINFETGESARPCVFTSPSGSPYKAMAESEDTFVLKKMTYGNRIRNPVVSKNNAAFVNSSSADELRSRLAFEGCDFSLKTDGHHSSG